MIRNHILTHENMYGARFGCKDEPVLLQQCPFSRELTTVITARLSMIDWTKDLVLYKAQRLHNAITLKEDMNRRSQNQFFTE